MKRFSLPLLALTLVLASTTPLRGQSNGLVPFIGGGLAMGTGDLKTDTNNGWLAFGGIDVPLDAWPGLALGVLGSFANIPYATGGFGESTQATTASAELSYQTGTDSDRRVNLYVRGGGGVQMLRYEPGRTGFLGTRDTRPAITGGIGLLFDVGSSASAFIGTHFFGASDVGLIGVNAGLAFPLGRSTP